MRNLMPMFAMSFAALQGCGGEEDVGERARAIAMLSGDATTGETFFLDHCVTCHDDNAMGIAGLGSDLTVIVPMLTDAELAQTLLRPPQGMKSFTNQQNQKLADVIAYLRTL